MKLPYTEVRSAIGALTKAIDKSKNLELSTAGIKLQSIISQLMSENDDLEHENKQLKDQLADAWQNQFDRSNLVKYKGVWVADEQTRKKIQLEDCEISDDLLTKMYCPRCLANKDQLISLNDFVNSDGFYVECPVCNFDRLIIEYIL
ncbi:hypothetical protein JK167_11470 [Levilactobacillus brevis]|uniref:Uncharacterized protein n=1 Tax=Levilactobacillus brevis TaxID=1580 RepID=A0AA41ERA6_LEVBR|nr:hypothetical protein [Levilactobacillus brevis]MBS0948303.1 hypothetical protein [Levilactobacillus brevis]MBS1011448.1 hypothetical protein [Levilactobacillus brevis]